MSDVSIHKMYLYDHVFQLLAIGDSFCSLKDTGPMNNSTPLRAHRGIDNKLIFRVLTPDRTPYDISCGQQVYARIIDPDNRAIALEKLCRLGPAKGIISLELDAGDLSQVAPGMYEMVLIRTEDFVAGIPDYYTEKPLYSDLNDNIALEIEITEQAFKAPLPSITLLPDNWTSDVIMTPNNPPMPCFYSSRIPGARILNHNDGVHSFSTYTTNFTGKLEMWATLDETPDAYLNDTRWFKIYPSTMSRDIKYKAYTGTQAWTFQANFMWLKFRYFPSQEVLDPGVMEKLIVRT